MSENRLHVCPVVHRLSLNKFMMLKISLDLISTFSLRSHPSVCSYLLLVHSSACLVVLEANLGPISTRDNRENTIRNFFKEVICCLVIKLLYFQAFLISGQGVPRRPSWTPVLVTQLASKTNSTCVVAGVNYCYFVCVCCFIIIMLVNK